MTIDTEGDDSWSRRPVVTTRNAAFVPRFQALCERFGLRPTYLVNHEMARDETFRAFGRDLLARGSGEIGMHLHAWDSPPLVPLTADDVRHHPFLMEFPEPVMRAKILALTELLEQSFGAPMRSHRAGRWAMSPSYARLLAERGYEVDCSVTPGLSWRDTKGDPAQSGGTDYRHFPSRPYVVDLTDLARPGDSGLLEIPVSIVKKRRLLVDNLRPHLPKGSWARRLLDRALPELVWLRPNGRNLGAMGALLEQARTEAWPCVEFMLHSSELMPGGSPTFPGSAQIEALYRDLEALFAAAAGHFVGATLSEFGAAFRASAAPRAQAG